MTTPAPSRYRFISTNALTGAVQSDSLPILGQSCSRQINAVGSFTGSIALPTAQQMSAGGYSILNQGNSSPGVSHFTVFDAFAPLITPGQLFQITSGPSASGTVYKVTSNAGSAFGYTNFNFYPGLHPDQVFTQNDNLLFLQFTAQAAYQVRQWVAALEPWKSILWVLQDGQPVWNGPITGLPHTTITDGQLAVQAASMEEFFKHRQISDNIYYINLDVFEIFRQLLIYALGKKPNGNISGTGRYANKSGVVDLVAYSGIIASLTEQSSLKKIYDVWNDLVTTYSLEYALTPAIADAGSMYTLAQMGLPMMGRKYTDTRLSVVFPSQGVIDYAWQRGAGASQVANKVVVTGSGGATTNASYVSGPSHGVDNNELNAEYPLLEDSATFSATVTAQSQIDSYADGLVGATAILKQILPTFTLGATSFPQVRDIMLGDEVAVAATSPLHPADPVTGAPGVTGLFRIIGWTLSFPSQGQPESTLLQLGGLNSVSL